MLCVSLYQFSFSNQSTPDGELSEDGVHAPHSVDWEHRHEHVHVSPVTRVELHVLEHRVNHDRAVKPSVS